MNRLLLLAAMLVTAGPLSAQVRPPLRVPARSTPPAVRSQPPLTPRIHGNSKSANRPTHVYGIYRRDNTTGKLTPHKFGISGGKTRIGSQLPKNQQRTMQHPGRDYSNRALRQVQRLNREAIQKGEKPMYTTRVLKRIPPQPAGGPTSRQMALRLEKKLVTDAAIKRTTPPGNQLPQPYRFSCLPKK